MSDRTSHETSGVAGARQPGVPVREAQCGDLAEVLDVQHHAFARVAQTLAIDPDDLPPLREALADLTRLAEEGVRFFVATADERIVGTVRAHAQDGVVDIGRLAVEDGFERRGVATALMDVVEQSFPEARLFRLFTGADAAAPLSLYSGRGYTVTHVESLGHVDLVWLEKPKGGHGDAAISL